LLLAWPAAAAAWRHGWRPALLLLAAGAVVVAATTRNEAALLGLAAGAVAAGLAAWRPTVARAGLALLLAAGVAVAPLLPRTVLDPPGFLAFGDSLFGEDNRAFNSAMHRVLIWRVTADHVAARPILGHGLDAARALYSEKDKRRMTVPRGPGRPGWAVVSEPIPLHPHNVVLQWWLELGGAGAALGLGLLILILRRATAPPEARERAARCGLLFATLGLWAVGYGAWQAWWVAAVVLAATAAAGGKERTP
jgi:O-antigen ligase